MTKFPEIHLAEPQMALYSPFRIESQDPDPGFFLEGRGSSSQCEPGEPVPGVLTPESPEPMRQLHGRHFPEMELEALRWPLTSQSLPSCYRPEFALPSA